MLILSVDTALRSCRVVLGRDDDILAAKVVNDEITHSSHVLMAVDAVLVDGGVKLADMDGFGITTGPGSFTGLRIGMSTVKGLALAYNKPVAGLSVLEILACQANSGLKPVTVVIDGSKREVFARTYLKQNDLLQPLGDYANLDYSSAAGSLPENGVLTGNGVPLIVPWLTPEQKAGCEITPATAWEITVETLAHLAYVKFKAGEVLDGGAVVPNYIRKSDAEIALDNRALA